MSQTAAVQAREKMLRIGKVSIGSIDAWTLSPGEVISWHPTTVAQEKALQAPISDVPVSYMQSQHIRGHYRQIESGLDY